MKKIKILFLLSIAFACLLIFVQISNYFIMPEIRAAERAVQRQIPFGEFLFWSGKIQEIVMFVGVLISIQCLNVIIKNGYFTATSIKLMKLAGYIYIILGIIMLGLDIFRLSNGADYNFLVVYVFLDGLLALFGFVILIISDMAQVGFRLKSENDLTI